MEGLFVERSIPLVYRMVEVEVMVGVGEVEEEGVGMLKPETQYITQGQAHTCSGHTHLVL